MSQDKEFGNTERQLGQKLDTAIKIISDAQKHNASTLVFCHYKAPLYLLYHHLCTLKFHTHLVTGNHCCCDASPPV